MANDSPFLTQELISQFEENSDLILGREEAAIVWAQLPVLETYYLALEQCTERRALSHAMVVGWHLLLRRPRGDVVAIIVNNDQSSGPVFEGIESGALTDAAFELIGTAVESQGHTECLFNPRLLMIPGLSLRALWYHGEGTDHITPLAQGPALIETSVSVSGTAFEEQLLPIARDEMESHKQLTANIA
ncbi:hypothetical protein [Pyruvatibacter sp.]|uniref:hypothetical protein n=1 Tax=Pyruvatibacter sp. TaxID=1981328 RepID=UPI003262D6F0